MSIELPSKLYYFLIRVSTVRGPAVPSSPILVTPIMEAVSSSETSVHATATRHNIPEDDIPHSNCREYLKSYIRTMKVYVVMYACIRVFSTMSVMRFIWAHVL
jgi:hypothetical protein